jgi:hypothetical protein
VTLVEDVLHGTDFLRGSRRALGDQGPYKEWHHFVVHGDEFRLIVNFSLTDPADPRPGGTVPRVIALVRHGESAGAVEEFAPEECDLRTGRVAVQMGPNSLALVDGSYELTLDLPALRLRGRLRLVPVSTPFVVNHQPLAPGSRLSWLFVPRLEAHGCVWVGERRCGLRAAPAYHDHNWGRFRWGDDFGWLWGSVLPSSPSDPWTIVLMRMTDRRRQRAARQGLYVWHGRDPAAMWRDGSVVIEHDGLLRQAPTLVLPPVMRVLSPGSASDLPASVTVRGGSDGDEVELRFEPDDYVRIVVPDERDDLGVVVLNEVTGRVTAAGRVGGRALELEGTGVFELLR